MSYASRHMSCFSGLKFSAEVQRGKPKMEGIATQKPGVREHGDLRLTPRSSGHRSLRSRHRPTGAGDANHNPGWHRTTPHCGGAAQLEPR